VSVIGHLYNEHGARVEKILYPSSRVARKKAKEKGALGLEITTTEDRPLSQLVLSEYRNRWVSLTFDGFQRWRQAQGRKR
jgi:hypothetical protein